MGSDPTAALRRHIYFLMIVISAGLMLGRIIAVDNLFDRSIAAYKSSRGQIEKRLKEKAENLKKTNAPPGVFRSEMEKAEKSFRREAVQNVRPFHSANDRSRWCTIRALVEPGMRVRDEKGNVVWFAIDKVQNLPGWDTIDMVKHPVPPGDPEAPEHLFSSKPTLLPVLMSIPYFLIYNVSGGALSFATQPHLIVRIMLVLINLIPTVFCWFLLSRMIDRFGKEDWSRIFVMGVVCFGTFVSTFIITLNNHVPGICFLIISMDAAVRIFFDGKRNLRYFATAALFAFLLVSCELPALSYAVFLLCTLLIVAPKQTLLGSGPAVALFLIAFFATNYAAHKTFSVAYGNPDWYIYKYDRGNRKDIPSHWSQRRGMDAGEPSKITYLYQTSFGHHGVFSLTPVWCLSVFGLLFWLDRWKFDKRLVLLSLFILSLSLICYVFYVFFRPQGDRNYGGMTCAFRWMFWFVPLWSLAMLPCLDRLQKSRFLRGLCLVLLLISCMSVAYPLWNPWDHPWYYRFMHYLNWDIIR